MRNRVTTALSVISCALIGAGYVLCGKLLTHEIHPISLTFLRIAITCIGFLPFIHLKRFNQLSQKDLALLFIGGIFGIFLTNILYFMSLASITPLQAALLNSLTPLLLLFLTNLYDRTVPSYATLVAFVIGLMGTFFMITQGKFTIAVCCTKGDMLMLFSVLCWVIYSLSARAKSESVSALEFTFGTLVVGLIPLTPLGIYHGALPLLWQLTLSEWLLLTYISLIATGLGYYVYTKSIEKLGPDVAAYIIYSITPLLVIVLSFLLLHKPITVFELLGSFFVIISLVIYLIYQN